MQTLIDDDLLSIITDSRFELLDDDENIIIDGIEINKKEYLKTLQILQNINNRKKERGYKLKL